MVNRWIRRFGLFLVLSVLVIGILAEPDAPSAEAATRYTAYVTANSVRVHTGAGVRYRSVGTYYKYHKMTIKGSRGNWKQITYGGHTRYVWGPSIKAGSPRIRSYIIPGSAWMRTGPGLKYGRVRYAYQNYYVTIYSRLGNWYHVNYRGTFGYVWAGNVKEGTPAFSSYNGYINAAKLYLRTDPRLVYKKIQALYKNNKVTVIGRSGNWLRLKIGSKTGYAWGQGISKGNPPVTPASYAPTTGNYGLDISHYQNDANKGNIDFNQVKASGYSFIIVKASEGQTGHDPYFGYNTKNAIGAGLKVDAYHFFHAADQNSARKEADNFASSLKAAGYNASNFGYVFLDVETTNSVDKETLADNANAFFDQLKNVYGFNKLGIYSNLYFFNNSIDFNRVTQAQTQPQRFLIWLSRYRGSETNLGPGANFNVDIWQYTNSGTVNGIVGDVDHNISYFNTNGL
ncbi:GH25 family lysozyme [Sporolactobacillus vineae]|uniref:GH25 family lysozyme n=1 Tax=Sporolactobacillus vineae TaxID=444463 RepID=UPI000289162E|nr:GH25 family lysozyme [Sporolactobacillus vineae]